MIIKNGKEVEEIYRGSKAIQTVYRAGYIVWEAVKSCFGKGWWINDKPWINNDVWKN